MIGGRMIKKLKRYIESKKKQMQKGLEVTEQMKAEKQRRKQQKNKYLEPGTISYGLAYRQHPLDLMKDVKEKRKQEREEKNKTSNGN